MREVKIINNIESYKCCKCGNFFPKDLFFKQKNDTYGITSSCKQCHILHNKEYRRKKPGDIDLINKRFEKMVAYRNQKRIEKYGYDRKKFHLKASYFIKKHQLKPKICPFCGKEEKIELHHPFYDNFADWSKIIYCCKSCHKLIHNNKIFITNFIDLTKIPNE